MSKFTPEEMDMLLVWSEYGERPFDGIVEMDRVPQFLNMLHRYISFGISISRNETT